MSLFTYAPLQIIILTILTISFFIFTLTTLLKNRKRTYPYMVGIFLMTILDIIILAFFYRYYWKTLIFTLNYYLFLLLLLFSFNVYFCINSHFIITYRKYKFYEDDYILAFYSYFIDWFSFFLYNLIISPFIVARRRRRRGIRKDKKTINIQ